MYHSVNWTRISKYILQYWLHYLVATDGNFTIRCNIEQDLFFNKIEKKVPKMYKNTSCTEQILTSPS